MKTAEEILNKHWALVNKSQSEQLFLSSNEIAGISDAINEARKEALILACGCVDLPNTKEEIKKLITELK